MTVPAELPAPSAPQPVGFLVVESKSSGRDIEVGRYDTEAEALSVVKLLRWAGAVARIERAP